MKAIVIECNGSPGKAGIQDVEQPPLRPGWIKVKTVIVALNPADHLHIDFAGQSGSIIGCDYAGIVEEVGPGCLTSHKFGDRVFGLVHGANTTDPGNGAFSEFIIQKPGLCGRIPDDMTFENASGLGVVLSTIAQVLYESLGTPLPNSPTQNPYPVLIYGGSTSQGTLAIQFAKLSGLTVITTCSPQNFQLVKSLGADKIFDYNDPTCGQQIRNYTSDSLYHVWDTIGIPSSARICAESLASRAPEGQELRYSCSVPLDQFPREDVRMEFVMGYLGFGEQFEKFGQVFPAMTDKYELVSRFWEMAVRYMEEGKVVPHPIEVCQGGLSGIEAGLQRLREKKVSGRKLIYRVSETPGL